MYYMQIISIYRENWRITPIWPNTLINTYLLYQNLHSSYLISLTYNRIKFSKANPLDITPLFLRATLFITSLVRFWTKIKSERNSPGFPYLTETSINSNYLFHRRFLLPCQFLSVNFESPDDTVPPNPRLKESSCRRFLFEPFYQNFYDRLGQSYAVNTLACEVACRCSGCKAPWLFRGNFDIMKYEHGVSGRLD